MDRVVDAPGGPGEADVAADHGPGTEPPLRLTRNSRVRTFAEPAYKNKQKTLSYTARL